MGAASEAVGRSIHGGGGGAELGGLVAEVGIGWGGEGVVLVFLDDLLDGVSG